MKFFGKKKVAEAPLADGEIRLAPKQSNAKMVMKYLGVGIVGGMTGALAVFAGLAYLLNRNW